MSNDMIIYNTEDGKSKISLKLENGTVWLSQLEIAELFETTKQNVSKHIKANQMWAPSADNLSKFCGWIFSKSMSKCFMFLLCVRYRLDMMPNPP